MSLSLIVSWNAQVIVSSIISEFVAGIGIVYMIIKNVVACDNMCDIWCHTCTLLGLAEALSLISVVLQVRAFFCLYDTCFSFSTHIFSFVQGLLILVATRALRQARLSVVKETEEAEAQAQQQKHTKLALPLTTSKLSVVIAPKLNLASNAQEDDMVVIRAGGSSSERAYAYSFEPPPVDISQGGHNSAPATPTSPGTGSLARKKTLPPLS